MNRDGTVSVQNVGILYSKRAPVPSGSTLQLHPQNPHYFVFRGQTTPLVGSTTSYMMAYFTDEDYLAFLNEVQSNGLNVVRLFGSASSAWGAAPNYITPFVKVGSKYDLSQWNSAWFSRLTDYVSQASRRSIAVEVTLFTAWYTDAIWQGTPYYRANNIQGLGNESWDQFTTLYDSGVVAVQDAFVERVVTALNGFDNVYYEICNEPLLSQSLDWHNHLMQVIANTEASLPAKHMIAVNGMEWLGLSVTPSIFNTHYTTGTGYGAFPLLDGYYGQNVALGFDETSVISDGNTADNVRVEAWEFLVGGGSVYDNLSRGQTNEANTQAIMSTLGVLKAFLAGFNLAAMSRDTSFIQGGVPSGAYARATTEPGRQYALYIHHSKPGANYTINPGSYQENLVLALAAGSYRADWVDPASGKALQTLDFTHPGGNIVMTTPTYSADMALRILARR